MIYPVDLKHNKLKTFKYKTAERGIVEWLKVLHYIIFLFLVQEMKK